MPQVSTPVSTHTGPAAVAGWQWLPFTSPTHTKAVARAMQIIGTRISGQQKCDAAFRALPGARSFAQVWTDPLIWISYDPGNTGGRFGATLGNDVTLSQYCCRMGVWTIVATLIHELAHINGATGTTHDAEQTLKSCLMTGHYDPTILGASRVGPPNQALSAIARKHASSRG